MKMFFSYFIQSQVFYPQLTLWQLIQPDLESQSIVRSQLGPSIQSGSSPSPRSEVIAQSTHLSKGCYPSLVSNPHHSKILPPKQLDYMCIPLHPAYATTPGMPLHIAKFHSVPQKKVGREVKPGKRSFCNLNF